MNIKKFITATSLLSLSLPSVALVPGTPEEGSWPHMDIYVSGSSSMDKQLNWIMKNKICQLGTLDKFTDDKSRPEGNKYSAYYCRVGSYGPSSWGNSLYLSSTYNLMLYKSSAGESFGGVGPVADALPISQLKVRDTPYSGNNCGPSPFGYDVAPHYTSIPVPMWFCYPNYITTDKVPDMGISDLEPALWEKLGNSFTKANLITNALNVNTFGIAVTVALRNALQTAQGLPSGSELAADQPNLSRIQVASLLQGRITSWDQFKVNGVGLPAASLVAPVNTRVQICRGLATAGVQAQVDVFFNHFPCGGKYKTGQDTTSFSNPSDGKMADDNLNPLPTTRALIHTQDTTSGISDCLSVLQDANALAVGPLPLEKSSAKHRFVRIDGALPTLKNVADNTYGDWFTSTINWRSYTSPLAPTGDKLKVLEAIQSLFTDPDVLASANSFLTQPGITSIAGEVGALALPYKPVVSNKVFSISNPVTTSSREGRTGTGSLDSCEVPGIVDKSEMYQPD